MGLEEQRLDIDHPSFADGPLVQEQDERLVERARQGEVPAFALLLQRHQDPVWRYLLHGCQDEAAAARMFRDLWFQVLHSLRRCELPSHFRSWLYGLAYHHLLDYDRLRCLATAPSEEWAAASETEGAGPAYRAIAALSVAQRALFLLQAEAQLTREEMTAAVGASARALRRRLDEMQSQLRMELEAFGVVTGDQERVAVEAYRQRAREAVPAFPAQTVLQQAQARLPVPLEAELGAFRGTRWRMALAALLVLAFCVLLALQQDPQAVRETLSDGIVPPPALTSSPPLIAEGLQGSPVKPAARRPAAPADSVPSIAEIRGWIAAGEEERAREALAVWQRTHPKGRLPPDVAAWAARQPVPASP